MVGASNASTLEPRYLVGERAIGADGVDRGQAVVARHLAVDFTEGGRLVHQARTVVRGDVVRRHDVAGVDAVGQFDVTERSLVVHTDEFRARQVGADLRALAEDRRHE